MKASELRIGNYLIMDDKPVQITGVLQHGFYFGEHGYASDILDWWKPIPLTEEWLIKFGFENGFKQFEWLNWGMYCEKGLADDWIISVGFGDYKQELKAVKHVHKLQNIFYEYSDEELIIRKDEQ